MKKSINLVKFGKRLKELKIKNKLTQEILAEKLGLSTNFIGTIERGERNTTVENIFNITEALKVSVSEFFTKDKLNTTIRNL